MRTRRTAGQKAREVTKEEKERLEKYSKRAKEQNADFIARTTEYHRAENKYLMYDEPALLDMYSELTKHLTKGVLQMSLVDFLAEDVEMQSDKTVSQIEDQREEQVTEQQDDEDGLNREHEEQHNDVDFEPAEVEEVRAKESQEEEQNEEHHPQTEENVLHQDNFERGVPLLGALSIEDTAMIEDTVEISPPSIHKAILPLTTPLPPQKPPRADVSTTTDSLQQTSIAASSFQSIKSDCSEKSRPRNARSLTVETPMGSKRLVVPKLPTIIAPRMKAKDKVISGRVLEGNELGFSINGSPLVAAPSRRRNEGIAEVFDQVLSRPEAELTPMSRDLATALKAALRSKFNNP